MANFFGQIRLVRSLLFSILSHGCWY